MKPSLTRRQFLGSTALAGAGVSLGLGSTARGPSASAGADQPALLGGKPVRTAPPQPWPVFDTREDQAMLDTVHSGIRKIQKHAGDLAKG